MPRHKLLDERGGQRTFAVVFATGDEACAGLLGFARENALSAASVTGIGAFRRITLGYFDWERKDYERIPIDEQVEVLSLLGDISLAPDGDPQLHVHAVVGKRDGSAHGGHLLGGEVRPTLELIVTETPAALRRAPDAESGLALISL